MNTFELCRAAIMACREHVCKNYCPRNRQGLCLTQIKLWDSQHRAALAWNAPQVPERNEEVTPDTGYL